MLRYALRTVAARKASFVGAFLALACAAALVTACGTLLETGLRGTIATERYAGTPLVVAGDQNVHHTYAKGDKTKHKAKPIHERVWLPAGTLDRVERVPGVRQAVPELTFPAALLADPAAGDAARTEAATAVTDERDALGHAWTSAVLTPFHVKHGESPRWDDEIVIDGELAASAGLRPGDRVTVQATAAPAAYTVVGVTREALDQQSAVFFTPTEARRLAGHPGRFTAVGVLPEPGVATERLADAVTAALDGTVPADAVSGAPRVLTGDDRGAAEFLAAAEARVELISMGGALGGTGLLVAVLVVVGTLALTIHQRQRELALLRAIAATPRQIRRLIGRETLAVAAVAGPLGAAAGLPLGDWLHGRFRDLGAVPAALATARSPFPAFAAVAATLAVAWLAARVSARRAARIRPAEALAEASAERRGLGLGRLLAGLLTLAGGVVLLAVLSALRTEPAAMPVTYLSVLLLAVAVALLGPALARAALTLLGLPLRAARAPGHLAAHSARANSRRLASVITPLTLLVAMAGTVMFTQTTLAEAAEAQVRDGVLADAALAAAPGSGSTGVPHAAAEALRGRPGITAVTEVVHTTVRTPGLDEYAVQGVTPTGLARTLDLDVTEGSLARLDEAGVAISDLVADHRGIHPGDELPLVLGDGTPVTLTVAAVYERGLGFGELTMAHSLVSRHIDNPNGDTVLIAGTAAATHPGRLAAALADFPAVTVTGPGHLADAQAAQREANAEVTLAAMGLVLAFTTIAAVNTLATSTADRSREFALLRLVGTTRRQVLRMLRLEAIAVTAIAVTLGTAITLATLAAFSAGMADGAAPAIAPLGYAALVATAAGLALAATAIPARVAMRGRPPGGVAS